MGTGDLGMFLSPDAKGEYFYGSGQNAVNWVWAQFLSGGTYQFSKNNLDALSPAVNLLSPGSYQNYLDYSERIEASLPESLPFQAGRLFGTSVSLAQSFEEVTTVGPGLIVAGTGAACFTTGIETAGIGCIAGAGASVAAGGAVIVHGLSVEAYSISNGYQIFFAKGRGAKPKGNWKPSGPNWTTNMQEAKKKLGLNDQEFREALHDLKKVIENNPDVWINIVTGDVRDGRSGEWIGNLLDFR